MSWLSALKLILQLASFIVGGLKGRTSKRRCSMNWKSVTASASTLPSLLAMMCLLAGCQSSRSTNIAATEKSIAADTCKALKPVTYSSRDTEQTKLNVRANNASRDAYCPS